MELQPEKAATKARRWDLKKQGEDEGQTAQVSTFLPVFQLIPLVCQQLPSTTTTLSESAANFKQTQMGCKNDRGKEKTTLDTVRKAYLRVAFSSGLARGGLKGKSWIFVSTYFGASRATTTAQGGKRTKAK